MMIQNGVRFGLILAACMIFFAATERDCMAGSCLDLPDQVAESAQQLDRYVKSKDFVGFDAAATQLAARWQGENEEGYFRFCVYVCSFLRKTDFKTVARFEIAENIALRCFRSGKAIPIGVCAGLLDNLRPTGEKEVIQEKATLWLRVLEQVQKAKDPKFNQSKGVIIPSYELPANANDPQQISAMKEQYAQEVEYLNYYNNQLRLRTMEQNLTQGAITFFKQAHLGTQAQAHTLEQMVLNTDLTSETKQLILKQVKARP